MTMVAGSVTIGINANGSAAIAGTGLAAALATARVASRLASMQASLGYPLVPLPAVGATSAPYSPQGPATRDAIAKQKTTLAGIYKGIEQDANADGPAIVNYILSHAVATVAVPATGLKDSGGGNCTGTAAGTGSIT